MALLTFYPDDNPEVTSVDGEATRVANESWASLRGGAGTAADDSRAHTFVRVASSSTTNQFDEIDRAFFLFDTNSLPDLSTIQSASIFVKIKAKTDTLGGDSLTLVSSNPASNTALANADYSTLGTTLLSDDQPTIASLTAGTFKEFVLNAAGIAAISRTGLSKFGFRLESDRSNTAPTWISNKESRVELRTKDAASGDWPYLQVTYKPSYDKAFTSSAIVKVKNLDAAFSTNAGIKTLDINKTLATDALVKATSTQAISSHGTVKEILAGTITTNAGVDVHDNDYSFTSDAIILDQSSEIISSNAIVKVAQDAISTTDGKIVSVNNATVGSDARVKLTLNIIAVTTDASVKETIEFTLTTDASSLNIPADLTLTQDAIIKLRDQEATLTTDSVIRETNSTSHTTDASVFQADIDLTFYTRGIVLVTPSALLGSDGVVKVHDNEFSNFTDAHIVTRKSSTLTSDAVTKEENQDYAVGADAIVKLRNEFTQIDTDALVHESDLEKIFTSHGIVLETPAYAISADGIVKCLDNQIEVYTDGRIVERFDFPGFTTDAYVTTVNEVEIATPIVSVSGPGGPFSYPFTVFGINRTLIVGLTFDIQDDLGRTVNYVEYAGLPMTLVAGAINNQGATETGYTSVWYLVNPPIGSNNVDISLSSPSNLISSTAILATGSLTISPIDGFNSYTGSGTGPTGSITTVYPGTLSIDVGVRFPADLLGIPEVANGQVEAMNIIDASYAAGVSSYIPSSTNPPGIQQFDWDMQQGVESAFAAVGIAEFRYQELEFTSDAIVSFKDENLEIEIFLKATLASTFDTDGIIKAYDTDLTTTTDGHIVDVLDLSMTTDAIVKDRGDEDGPDEYITTDAMVKSFDNDLTLTSDAVIKVTDIEITVTTDGLVFTTVDSLVTTDGIVETGVSNTFAGLIMLESIEINNTIAGQVYLEEIQEDVYAGLITLEAIKKDTQAGAVLLESERAQTVAGLITLEDSDIVTFAGEVTLESYDLFKTFGGSINLELNELAGDRFVYFPEAFHNQSNIN